MGVLQPGKVLLAALMAGPQVPLCLFRYRWHTSKAHCVGHAITSKSQSPHLYRPGMGVLHPGKVLLAALMAGP